MVDSPNVVITIGKYWHWAIGSTLTVNIAAFVRLFWWINTHYRKYRREYIELLKEYNEMVDEHDILVEDFNKRNPPGRQIIPRCRREEWYDREARYRRAHRFQVGPR